jgi:intracellular sulfur oxidation DsrE/DsrF family protein
MFERGHPLTIFFNDRGILVTSKGNGDKFKEQQAALAELAKAGATLIACPICMKHYGIKESDLLEGIKVGNSQLTGDALFRDNTKTLSW